MTDAEPTMTNEELRTMTKSMRNMMVDFSNRYLYFPVLILPILIISASIIMIGSVVIHQSTKLLQYNQGLSDRQRYLLTTNRTVHIVIIVLNALVIILVFFVLNNAPPHIAFIIVIMGSIILSIVLISIMFANDLLTDMKWLLVIQGLNALLFVIWCILNIGFGGCQMALFIKKYLLRDPQFQKDLSILYDAIVYYEKWDDYKNNKKFLDKLRREFRPE